MAVLLSLDRLLGALIRITSCTPFRLARENSLIWASYSSVPRSTLVGVTAPEVLSQERASMSLSWM